MCIAFATNGYCQNEGDCKYAHGPHELRSSSGPVNAGMNMRHVPPKPPNISGLMSSNQYKTAMCKSILEMDHCTFGDRCNFAHSSMEVRAKKPSAMPPGMMPSGSNEGGGFKRKRENVKSVLCQNFTTFGKCQYGNNCSFAHGVEDLSSNKKPKFYNNY